MKKELILLLLLIIPFTAFCDDGENEMKISMRELKARVVIIWNNGKHKKLGYTKKGVIYNASGKRIGSVKNGIVFDTPNNLALGNPIGRIKGGKIYNSGAGGRVVGTYEKGKVKNLIGTIIGITKDKDGAGYFLLKDKLK